MPNIFENTNPEDVSAFHSQDEDPSFYSSEIDRDHAIRAVGVYLAINNRNVAKDAIHLEAFEYTTQTGWKAIATCKSVASSYFEIIRTETTEVRVSLYTKADLMVMSEEMLVHIRI